MHKGGHAPRTHPLLPCMLPFPPSPQFRARGRGATRCLRCHDLKSACCPGVSPALWARGERSEGGDPAGAYHAPLRLPIKCVCGRGRGDHTHLKESDLEMRGSNPSGRLPFLGRISGAAQNKRQGRKRKLPLGGFPVLQNPPCIAPDRPSPFLRGGQDLTCTWYSIISGLAGGPAGRAKEFAARVLAACFRWRRGHVACGSCRVERRRSISLPGEEMQLR